jgi:hypothetical protein
LLAFTTRSQYLATSRLVGSPEPPWALASRSRAIVHRLSPRFTLCGLGLLGWVFSLGSFWEPPEFPDGGPSFCAGDVPAAGNR